MYLHFDWSNNCGDVFRRELVKTILTVLNHFNCFDRHRDRHSFRLMKIRLKLTNIVKIIYILRKISTFKSFKWFSFLSPFTPKGQSQR